MRSDPTLRPPARPRVVLAIESSGPGGAEHVVLRLAQALQADGARVIVATQQPGWLTERVERAGAEVWLVPQRPGLDPAWVVHLALRLRRERIDVLHAHEFAMGLFGGIAARLAGVRVVATLHGRQWLAGRASRQRAWRLLARFGIRHVAVSTDLAAWLAARTRLPPAAIAVVENGIAIAPERPAEEVAALRADVRRELGLPPDTPLVVAVGNLYPVKDHATLVQALAALPDVHLAIAGRGDERDALVAQAAALGAGERLHLLGLRDDVDRWLAAADLFAHSSRSEEMPLAVLEAMAAGCAVVATRVGGIPDAVVAEETGLLVEPGDAAALAVGIRGLLADPARRRAWGRAGRARVVSRFGLERMVARYRALYDGVAPDP